MAAPEPVANGTLTPPQVEVSATATPGTKRKRDESEDAAVTNGSAESEAKDDIPEESDPHLQDTLKDILAALRRHDTTPSILDATLPKGADDTIEEPSAKRQKLTTTTNIAARLENGYYATLDALVSDVEAVVDKLLEPIKVKEISLPQTQYGRPSSLLRQETQFWNATIAFQKLVSNIVKAEKERQKLVRSGKRLLKKPESEETEVEGRTVKKEDDADNLTEGKPVLTLFANAPGPKQLFSSFQLGKEKETSNGVLPALRDNGLPAFISTTNIPPIELEDAKKKSKGLTLGELFPSPANLPRLQPPKQMKNKLVTTGNTVDFIQVDIPVRSNRKNSYSWFSDKQSVGQWIGYGGLDAQQEPSSPQAKRKQRDRALSTGEAFLPPTEGEKIALRHARDDALFKRAYGSFAPNRDDSVAVVPTVVKNEVWMSKIEERLAQKVIIVDPELLGEEDEPDATERTKDIESFQEVVDNFDPALLEWDGEKSNESKEMDEILQEISDLLETLSSYQRIRNSSLNTSSRTTVGQSNPVTDLMGTPSTPSSAEMEVYKTLKLQLAVMINQLPPYAVARLNGDQLQELNIKQTIAFETGDARGVMAEDEAARQARIQAYAAAAGSQQSAARTPTSNQYANYNSSTNQFPRVPATQPQIRPSGPQGFYTPGPQTAPRPNPIQYQRPSSGVQTYSAGYPSTTQRSTYQQPSFSQSGSRPANYQANSSSYQASNSQFYQQIQQAANKSGFTQQYHPATPQAQRSAYPPNTPSSSYQRPASTAQMYSGLSQAQSPHARTASPLAAAPPTPAPSTNSAGGSGYNRPAYSTPASSSTNPSYYRQSSTAGQQQYQPGLQGTRPPTMTPTRQSSGTPQPPQGGGYPHSQSQQVNGTSQQPHTPLVTGQSS